MSALLSRKRTLWFGVVLVAVALGWTVGRSRAQGPSPLLPLAEPRPDPILLIPAVTKDSLLRVSGTFECSQGRQACAAPLVGGHLRMWNSTSFFDVFTDIPLTVVESKAAAGRFGFTGMIQLSDFLPAAGFGVGSASVTINRSQRGSYTAGVYVEETSAAPMLSPYVVGLAEPRPDPILQIGPLLP